MIIGHSAFKYQPETIQWVANILANSGTVSEATVIANDALVRDLKSYSLRSKIKHMLTVSGGNLAAARCPIIYDSGSSIATNYNFVAGDYTETGGLTGNGSSKYLDLGFPSSFFHNNTSCSLGCYVAAAGTSNPGNFLSAITNSWTATAALYYDGSNKTCLGDLGGSGVANDGSATRDTGLLIGSRTANNLVTYYDDGSSQGTGTSTDNMGEGFSSPSINLYAFAAHVNDGSDYASLFSNARCWLFFVGDGLSSTDVANLGTCISTFKTRMGR